MNAGPILLVQNKKPWIDKVDKTSKWEIRKQLEAIWYLVESKNLDEITLMKNKKMFGEHNWH